MFDKTLMLIALGSLLIVCHCVSKNIPNIFNCNLKKTYLILINSSVNIPDRNCHQRNIQFPTSSNVCSYTT